MNKMLWLNVILLSIMSLHGMDIASNTIALRTSMMCGLVTGAAVVGGLGSIVVDQYEQRIGQYQPKRQCKIDDIKIEIACAVLACAETYTIFSLSASSDEQILQLFTDNSLESAFTLGAIAGAMAGASLVCVKNNRNKYYAPNWEPLPDFGKRINNLQHHPLSAVLTRKDDACIKYLAFLDQK